MAKKTAIARTRVRRAAMAPAKAPRQPSRRAGANDDTPYHHGALRVALLQAAEMLRCGITAMVDHFRYGALPTVEAISAAFRAYAHPYFSQGKGWSFHSVRRDINMEASGVAWFDEALETPNLGPARGSGVLLKDTDGQWKIAQYNLSVPIPNERFAEVKKLLESK